MSHQAIKFALAIAEACNKYKLMYNRSWCNGKRELSYRAKLRVVIH